MSQDLKLQCSLLALKYDLHNNNNNNMTESLIIIIFAIVCNKTHIVTTDHYSALWL